VAESGLGEAFSLVGSLVADAFSPGDLDAQPASGSRAGTPQRQMRATALRSPQLGLSSQRQPRWSPPGGAKSPRSPPPPPPPEPGGWGGSPALGSLHASGRGGGGGGDDGPFRRTVDFDIRAGQEMGMSLGHDTLKVTKVRSY